MLQPGALRVRFNENFPRGAATPRERCAPKFPYILRNDPATTGGSFRYAYEAAGRLQNRKETSMTTIGTFTRDGDGFVGTIATLAIKAKAAIKPNSKTAENAPDYRIYASGVEIGAAWSKKSEANKPYLSIKLDDPSFA